MIDREAPSILSELSQISSSEGIIELVKGVVDSQKHFYLFLTFIQKKKFDFTLQNEKSRRSIASNETNSLILSMKEFSKEVISYVEEIERLKKMRNGKERTFPYQNDAILEDFKKISSLSLLMKLLKKEPRTEAEDIKIKVFKLNVDLPG